MIWSDQVCGVEGNFFGLIDDHGNMIQFYFYEDIPDHIDDAGHLRIVLMEFPQRHQQGSYAAHGMIAEVHGLIEKVFRDGANYRSFEGLDFMPWKRRVTGSDE